MAAGSSAFHLSATSFANGSSGFGAPNRACIDNKIVLICNAGDQLPATNQQMLIPKRSCGLTLQDIQTDSAKLVNVGMVYFGKETDLRWSHRVIVWEEEFKLEDAA